MKKLLITIVLVTAASLQAQTVQINDFSNIGGDGVSSVIGSGGTGSSGGVFNLIGAVTGLTGGQIILQGVPTTLLATDTFDLTADLTNLGLTGLTLSILGASPTDVLGSVNFLQSDFLGNTTFSVSVGSNFSGIGAFGIAGTGTGATATGGSIDNLSVTSVPEPSTFALVALGGLGLAFLRRRR